MGKRTKKRIPVDLTVSDKVKSMVNNLKFDGKKFLIFFEEIKDHEFFDDELGSIDRRARHINPVMFFDNINDLKNLLTEVVMISLAEDTNVEIPFEQQINILTIKQVYESFHLNINAEHIISEIKKHGQDTTKKQDIFKRAVNDTKFKFLRDLPDDLFKVMSLHQPKDYITYTDCKSFPYSNVESKLLTHLFVAQNIMFSAYAVSMHLEKTIPLWIVELDNHELLRLFELFMPDFEGSLNKEAFEKSFPMYQIWEAMELDLWKSFKPKRFSLVDFLNDQAKYMEYANKPEVDADTVEFSIVG